MEENIPNLNIQNTKKEKILSWPLVCFMIAMVVYAKAMLFYLESIKELPVSTNGVSSKNNLDTERNKAVDEIRNEFASIEAQMGWTPAAEGFQDFCERPIQDTRVANRCTYIITKFYGFSGDFKEQALHIDDNLKQIGWVAILSKSQYGGRGLEYIITNYFDKYYAPNKPPANFSNGYLVSNLPGAGYEKSLYEDVGGTHRSRANEKILSIHFAERSTKNLSSLKTMQNSLLPLLPTFQENSIVDVDKIFTQITEKDEYVIGISIRQIYFQN